jgi:predicted dinucleotide-binding enzyme
MRIGVIGAGQVGTTLGELLVRAGNEVALAHAGATEELAERVARLGDRAYAGTVEETVRFGDVMVLALPFGRYGELPPERFVGKIVVDATNYYPDRDGFCPELDDELTTSSELIARHLADARVVKAFNNLPMDVVRERARPRGLPDRLALPMSSDYPEAKLVVARLVDETGFDPIDLGGLADGGRLQQKDGPLYLEPRTIAELRAELDLFGDHPPAP